MKEFLSSLSQQSSAPGTQEGLPYWIFFFLLSIILLLVLFIFLRDKDLRRRINMFFFGTKQKLIKIRLQRRMKREKRKKDELNRDMGKTVWEKKLDLADVTPYFESLTNLEKDRLKKEQAIAGINRKISLLKEVQESDSRDIEGRMSEHLALKKKIEEQGRSMEEKRRELLEKIQAVRKNIRAIDKETKINEKFIQDVDRQEHLGSEESDGKKAGFLQAITDLASQKEEADKQAEALGRQKNGVLNSLKLIQKEIAEHDKTISALAREDREKKHYSTMEIKALEREKDKYQQKIEELVSQTLPLFQELGKLADRQRPKQLDLAVYYSQVDRALSRIEDLKEQIKKLS